MPTWLIIADLVTNGDLRTAKIEIFLNVCSLCMHICSYVPLSKHLMTFSAATFIPILPSAIIS